MEASPALSKLVASWFIICKLGFFDNLKWSANFDLGNVQVTEKSSPLFQQGFACLLVTQ